MKKTIFAVVMVVLLLLSMSLVGGAALAADDYGNTETSVSTTIPVVLGIDVQPPFIDFGEVAGDEVSTMPGRTITIDSEWIGEDMVTHGSNCDQWITTKIFGEERAVHGEKLGHTNGLLRTFGPTDYTPVFLTPDPEWSEEILSLIPPVVYLNGVPQMADVEVTEDGWVNFTGTEAPEGGQLVTIDYASVSILYSDHMTFNDLALGGPGSTEVLAKNYTRGLVDNEMATAEAQIYPPHDYPYGVNNIETAQVVFYSTPDVGTPHYTLTMAKTGNGSTDPANGVHTYLEGEEVTITAYPAAGSDFDGWTGDVADPNSATTTVTMDASKTVTANFSATTYDLTIEAVGDGTTTPAPGTYTYGWHELVNISAIPGATAEFGGWSGDVADPGSASTTVFMDADKTVTANFGDVYTLTMAVDPVATGSTNPAVGVHSYSNGTVVTLTATDTSAAPFWYFTNWTGDIGGADPNSATIDITMDADKSVTAHFALDVAPVVASVASPADGSTVSGTVLIDANFTDDRGLLMSAVLLDAPDPSAAIDGSLVMYAPPMPTSDHYTFSWDSTTVADGPHMLFVVVRDFNNQGSFVIVNVNVDNVADWDLNIAVDPVATGSTNPAAGVHSYVDGTVVTLTATDTSAAPFWYFTNWTGDIGGADPNSATIDITMDADKSVTAHFALDAAPVVASVASPADGSTVSGTVLIDANFTDDRGLLMSAVLLDAPDPSAAIDGSLVMYAPPMPTSDHYTFSWDSTTVANGSHMLFVVVRDFNNQGSFVIVNVNVDNVIPAPVSWVYETYYNDSSLYGAGIVPPEIRQWTLNDEGIIADMVIGLDPTAVPPLEAVGTGDGLTLDFALDHAYLVPETDSVYVNGLPQTRNTNYTINNDTGVIHFAVAPPAGQAVTALYKYFADTMTKTVQYIDNVLPPTSPSVYTGQVLYKGSAMAVLAVQKDYYEVSTGHKVYIEGAIYLFGTTFVTAYQSFDWTSATEYTMYTVMVPGNLSPSLNEHHHIEVGTPETLVTAAGTYDCAVTLDYIDEKETFEDSNVYGPPTNAAGTPSAVPLLTRTEWRDTADPSAGLIKFEISTYNTPMIATLTDITWVP